MNVILASNYLITERCIFCIYPPFPYVERPAATFLKTIKLETYVMSSLYFYSCSNRLKWLETCKPVSLRDWTHISSAMMIKQPLDTNFLSWNGAEDHKHSNFTRQISKESNMKKSAGIKLSKTIIPRRRCCKWSKCIRIIFVWTKRVEYLRMARLIQGGLEREDCSTYPEWLK